MCDAAVAVGEVRRKTSESEGDAPVCWICHEGEADGRALASPCRCRALTAHAACAARWQLQQAGRAEERFCRFCATELPDWRDAHAHLPKAPPVMSVVHAGVTHQVAVAPGAAGKASFEREIRRIFGLAAADAVSLTFGCRIPETSAADVTLEGWDSYDAAVHCASISAGQRLRAPGGAAGAAAPPPARAPAAPGALRRLFSRG
jgi:hypothetical protein